MFLEQKKFDDGKIYLIYLDFEILPGHRMKVWVTHKCVELFWFWIIQVQVTSGMCRVCVCVVYSTCIHQIAENSGLWPWNLISESHWVRNPLNNMFQTIQRNSTGNKSGIANKSCCQSMIVRIVTTDCTLVLLFWMCFWNIHDTHREKIYMISWRCTHTIPT